MLERMQKKINSKIVVCCQGGNNYDIMTFINQAFIRLLIGEGYPNKNTFARFYNIDKLRDLFKISRETYKNMKKNLITWSKYWPCLNSEKMLKYQNSTQLTLLINRISE